MANIPTVAGSLVKRATYAGAEANAGALMAPGGALVGMGGAIARAGEVSMEFAQRAQHAKNTADILDAGLRMEQTQAAFQDEMATNQDEETWVPNWQKNVTKLKADILGDGSMPPQVRNQLENQFSAFEAKSTIQVTTQAKVRTIQRQKARLMNVADTMWKNGDFERGKIAIEAMAGAGLINDDQVAGILREGEVKVDMANANRGINKDPIATYDALTAETEGGKWQNFTALDENQRESLKVEARRGISALRAETVNDIVDRRNAGEIFEAKELQTLVDQRKLTAGQMKWVLQEQARAKKSAGTTKHFAELLTQIDQYDKTKDPTNERFAELAAARLALPAELQQEAKSRLDKQANPTGEHLQTKLANGYIDDLLSGGFFGPTKGGLDGGTLEQAEAAFGQAIELKRELQRYVDETPAAKSDPVMQRDFINRRIHGKIDVKAATPVFDALTGRAVPAAPPAANSPAKVGSKAQRDALPAGTSYIGPDGKTYIKR